VRLNQIVLPSGHNATNTNTNNIGVKNSHAVLVLLFIATYLER
jgi:hypothetical protein